MTYKRTASGDCGVVDLIQASVPAKLTVRRFISSDVTGVASAITIHISTRLDTSIA